MLWCCDLTFTIWLYSNISLYFCPYSANIVEYCVVSNVSFVLLGTTLLLFAIVLNKGWVDLSWKQSINKCVWCAARDPQQRRACFIFVTFSFNMLPLIDMSYGWYNPNQWNDPMTPSDMNLFPAPVACFQALWTFPSKNFFLSFLHTIWQTGAYKFNVFCSRGFFQHSDGQRGKAGIVCLFVFLL